MGSSTKRRKKDRKKVKQKQNYPENKNPFATEDDKKRANKWNKFKTKKKEGNTTDTANKDLNPFLQEEDVIKNTSNVSLIILKPDEENVPLVENNLSNKAHRENIVSESTKTSGKIGSTNGTNHNQKPVGNKGHTIHSNENSLTANLDDEKSNSLRMYRTASVSKSKNKKLRIKKLAKRLNKNKKSKQKVLEIPVENTTVVRRQTITKKPPQPSINQLQTEVEQVTEVARSSLYLVAQERQNELDTLLQKTTELSEKSIQFQQVCKETKQKQRKSASWCGIGSTFSACFSKCACGNRIKKKRDPVDGKTADERTNEIEDRYRRISKPTTIDQLKNEDNALFVPMKTLSSKNSSARGSTSSLNLPGAGGSKQRGIGSSLPQINILPTRPLSNLIRRDRKSSSTSALDKPMSEKQLRKQKEKSERSIQEVAGQFEDEEMRKRAESLLRMDLNF